MFRRTSLLASLLFISASCSSPQPATQQVAPDTEPVDTGPAEDTAPWLTYPPGPYGLNREQTINNFTFKGYRNGIEGKAAAEWTDISLQDYYNPTGERGVHAILLVVSAEWCAPCKAEAKELPKFYNNIYKARGARFLTAMIEDSKGNPAEQPVVDRWVNAYQQNFDIVADPDRDTMIPSGSIPRNYIINPRDMKIYRVNIGAPGDEATKINGLGLLLDYNGAPPAPDAGTTD